MTRKAKTLFLAAIIPLTCQGQSWKEIGRDQNSTTNVDTDSIKVAGEITHLWTLWNYDQPQSADGKSMFESIRSKALVNCLKGVTADADYSFYSSRNAGGIVVFSGTSEVVFTTPEAGSKSALILDFACRGSSKDGDGGGV